MLISFFFFIFATVVYLKNKQPKLNVVISIVFFCFYILLTSFYLLSDYFTGDGITYGVFYHTWYGFGGAGIFEYKYLIFGSILSIVLLTIFFRYLILNASNNINKPRHSYVSFLLIILAFYFNPASSDLSNILSTSTERKNILISEKYNFNDFYKNPEIKQIGKKKNLVFVYAESFEQTYSNDDIFPGLTPGLNNLSKRAISFNNLSQVKGSSFTIGGMVASQCGLSLVGIPYGNSMSGMDTFLPNAVCLGDLLKKEGYYLSYFGGANSNFSGKDNFYKTHSFDEVSGLKELSIYLPDATYKTSWGIYDDSLLDIAYDQFLKLSKEHSNFSLFLLTLDMHQPAETPSKSCDNLKYKDGKDDTLNAVHCSDYLISKFVNKILKSPYAENTVIVIASDHLAPHDPISELSKVFIRSNRLMIISSDITMQTEINRVGATLDIGTTILPFIGFKGDIGLGRNLLSQQYSVSEINLIQEQITAWKKQFAYFWSFPKIKNNIQVNQKEKSILIDGRKFKVPVLVEIDNNLQTNLKFQFDLEFSTSPNKSNWDLISQIKNLSKRDKFLLVDTCENIQKITITKLPDDGFCLVASRTDKEGRYQIFVLNKEEILTLKDIKYLTEVPSFSSILNWLSGISYYLLSK